MTRPTNPADPTAERTAEQSTQTAGGLSGGRERSQLPEQDDKREDEEIIPRSREERGTTARRYEHADDKALPSDDPTYRTEI